MHTKNNGWLKHWDFILIDLLCLNITFLCAYWIRLGFRNMYASSGYRMMLIVIMIMHFCISFFSNSYSGILKRGYLKELKKVILHNVILFSAMFAYMFILQLGNEYSRTILIGFFFLDTIFMYLIHIIMKKIYFMKGVENKNKIQLLILSTEDYAEKAIGEVTDGPDKRFKIIGIAIEDEDYDRDEILGIPVVARGMEVYEFARKNVVDNVLICMDTAEQEKIEAISKEFWMMGVATHVRINSMFGEERTNVWFGCINNVHVMTTGIRATTAHEIFLKRALDICAGIAGCIISGVLYIFLAPAIKIADPKGGVFFSQERVGKNGRIFKIYKFRSMYADAEERKKELMEKNKMDGLMFKIDEDPRIIGGGPDGKRKGLGHFLRTSSLDEFPNFWSILKGDMSLVGTRPPTMDEYERYESHHKSRLAMKPGLTGMWQVSGRSDLTDFEEIVKLDNQYIMEWSLGLDIKIIFKTLVAVIRRKGSQ